jgi:hypothetical protein
VEICGTVSGVEGEEREVREVIVEGEPVIQPEDLRRMVQGG